MLLKFVDENRKLINEQISSFALCAGLVTASALSFKYIDVVHWGLGTFTGLALLILGLLVFLSTIESAQNYFERKYRKKWVLGAVGVPYVLVIVNIANTFIFGLSDNVSLL